jgi:apolipoprotein N-acyltransferase
VTFDAQGRPYNSAILIGADGKEAGRYSKMNLVPFGEFVPPLFSWIQKISTEAGDFAPGKSVHTLQVNDLQLGTFICYESAFPHFVRRFVSEGANVLVNISNDGWFFDTAAREQHLLLARMRAIENRRWLLRVTNNGITASIDPSGRVREQQREFRETAARLHFDPISETTFYSRAGDWFAWGCLLFATGMIIRAELPTRRRL